MAYIGFPEPSPSSQLRLFAGRRRAFSQKSAPMSLFRPEATERHSQRLTGSVSMAVPIGWHLAGYLMAGALFLALMFVSLASYSRIVTATGVISPDNGVAAIVPPRAGVIMELMVSDGEAVKAGQELVAVRSEDFLVSGESASEKIAEMLERQRSSLNEQITQVENDETAQTAQFAAQIEGLGIQIGKLLNQIGLQAELIRSGEDDLGRIRSLAEKGVIPRREVILREDALTERQQQLAGLESTLTQRRSDLSDAHQMLEQVKAKASERKAALQSQREDINRNIATNEQSRAYIIRSPVSGTVSALTARVGEPLNTQKVLMSIVPEDATLHAQLDVPNSAVGFIEVGQKVRLAIDAFPYESFGTISGRVRSLSKSPVRRIEGNGERLNYLVIVDLERQQIDAFGKNQPFFPGMTLSARIATARQSLLEWLFEPLFALRRR
ncbi:MULTISPECIES: HlyD family efflux transporter periplasmic adaptor subunit [Neorhizobium]|uniref:HlyD family efflux transporter periplasmic adaptor subunit n=1 Tax=Neorhizobium sp. T6_25 TaxID=2093833 RepID=UPI001FE071E3|nr:MULTISPECIES: HlyD family efflux transporter periplasmic adaptor subunit [Neorhizobium]